MSGPGNGAIGKGVAVIATAVREGLETSVGVGVGIGWIVAVGDVEGISQANATAASRLRTSQRARSLRVMFIAVAPASL